MQQLMDFLPLLAFFIAFKVADIYVATGVLIIASLLQIFCDKFLFGRFKKTHIILFLVLLGFGSLTIVFKDPVFLKWKVTVVELIMAAAFFISQYLKKPLVAIAFKSLNLPIEVLNRVNMSWAIFSLIIAVLNIAIAFGLPMIMDDQERALNIWVDFKVWGIMAFSLILVIINGKMIYPYMPKEVVTTKANEESTKEIASENKTDNVSRNV